MEEKKMQLVLHNGEIKEVDTSFIFNNQYNATDGKRYTDREVKYILNDIRLGEFYCCSVKQGSYEECLAAIKEERSKTGQCKGCYWHGILDRIEEECSETKIETDDKLCVTRITTYKKGCKHEKYGKCVHDIAEQPKLFREAQNCFFCEYPQGVPDMTDFILFMIKHAEKYGIKPRWSSEEPSIENDFEYKKLFGSYRFIFRSWRKNFELRNARNQYSFYFDVENKKFILFNSLDYEVVDKFTESHYDWKTQKSIETPIKNYDKFEKWFKQIVEDYLAERGVK